MVIGSLKLFSDFHLSVFGHSSHCSASLLDYHENHLTWVDSSMVVPLETQLSFECLLAIAHVVQPPCLAITRTIWSEWTWAWWPPLSCLRPPSQGPASPPEYPKNHLIWVNSIWEVPLCFHTNSPLNSPWVLFVWWSPHIIFAHCSYSSFFHDWIFCNIDSLISVL